MRGRGRLSVSVSEQLFVSPVEKEEKEKAMDDDYYLSLFQNSCL